MRRRVGSGAEGQRTGGEINEYEVQVRPKKHLRNVPSHASFFSSIGALVVLALVYCPFVLLARKAMYQGFVTPLPENASLHQISEGRIFRHIFNLAEEIGVRQVMRDNAVLLSEKPISSCK